MTDFMSDHRPSPEFRASLEREIARAFRSETQFGYAQRTRRLGMVVGMAAGAVVMLTIGLVLGVRTGYASAEVIESRGGEVRERSPLDILRAMPVRTALAAFACEPPAPRPKVAALQKGIPLIDLPAATTRAAETFGAIVGVRQSRDGKVLVNDIFRHQLKLFDSTLTTSTTVLDSTQGSSISYGPVGLPLLPFLGDSSLMVDWNAQTLLVVDGHGQVARGLAMPSLQDFRSVTAPGTGIDAKGRLVFRAMRSTVRNSSPNGGEFSDSIAIVRSDLDQRKTDTIARFARPLISVTSEKYSDGSSGHVYAFDPLQSADEWAVLSNGAVAIVRGHDYHIDWIQPDGSMTSTAKMPFEWKHFTDDDKQRLADSVRGAQNGLLASGYPNAEQRIRGPMQCGGGRGGGGDGDAGRGGGRGTGRSGNDGTPPPAEAPCWMRTTGGGGVRRAGVPSLPAIPPMIDLTRGGPIADYDPPLTIGGTLADRDGNLWILPRTTKLAPHGELVYDVVNAKGELFERVRVPAGRAIAGFGPGGVVYLTTGDLNSGFTLERTKLDGKK